MPLTPTIECKYSCRLCGLHRAVCHVPVRKEGQDVVDWLRRVCTPAIQRNHYVRSPLCRATEISELMIPIDKDAPRPGHPVKIRLH